MTLSKAEQGLIEPIDLQAMLDQVLAWAHINSGTTNLDGLAAMAEQLSAAFAELPGDVELVDPGPVERITPDGNRQHVECGRHLVVRVRPDANRRVLLTGHMDTVFAKDDPFQRCRWLDDNILHGPGTADMKGGLALMLAGLKAFEAGRPSLGYDVLINSDEETGSLSSAQLIDTLTQGKLAALTYEPALPDGSMARARPGSGNFSAIVTGRSAHAGRNPEDGRNALVAAADLALRLHQAKGPALKINAARIDGGSANNIVPDHAVLRFNIRPRTLADAEEAAALIDRLIGAVAAEHDVTIDLHGGFGRPPKAIGPESERLFAMIVQAAGDLGEDLHWSDTGGVCDGNNIARCGVPVIDTMGARGGNIHSPDEFMLADSLLQRARLTALVLHRMETEADSL